MSDDSMQSRSLGEISLDPDTFDLDLKINEGYQAYGSELLRVALLAIAGLAAVWLKIYLPGSGPSIRSRGITYCLVASFAFLTLSSAASLFFKYSSADSLAYHLTALRRRRRNRPSSGSRLSDIDLAKKQEAVRQKLFARCTMLLISSIAFLLVGVVSFGIGLIFLMKH